MLASEYGIKDGMKELGDQAGRIASCGNRAGFLCLRPVCVG